MPFTILCHHHYDGRVGRSTQHWDDRDGAVRELSARVERLARETGFSEENRRQAVAEAVETGRFVMLGVVTWVVAEIDQPDQPVIEVAEWVRQFLPDVWQDCPLYEPSDSPG